MANYHNEYNNQSALLMQLQQQQASANAYQSYLGGVTISSGSTANITTGYLNVGNFAITAGEVAPIKSAVVPDPDCIAWLKGRVDEICWHA